MALWLLLFALLAPTPALAVVAAGHAEENAAPGTQELSDDDLLILEVRLNRFVLADAIGSRRTTAELRGGSSGRQRDSIWSSRRVRSSSKA
jgi:hypothetical protein